MVNNYIAEQGDIVNTGFNPQRPALVISNKSFNKITKFALVCPITNTFGGYPLHIALDNRTSTTGFIMCEQVKSLDIFARNVIFKEKVPMDILEEVVSILNSFVESEQQD